MKYIFKLNEILKNPVRDEEIFKFIVRFCNHTMKIMTEYITESDIKCSYFENFTVTDFEYFILHSKQFSEFIINMIENCSEEFNLSDKKLIEIMKRLQEIYNIDKLKLNDYECEI